MTEVDGSAFFRVWFFSPIRPLQPDENASGPILVDAERKLFRLEEAGDLGDRDDENP